MANKRKFDTCFFERYAQVLLETLLGPDYADLLNFDRPDLQTIDKRLGIEVTRAMNESKDAANNLLKEMAGMTPRNTETSEYWQQVQATGYGYGLPGMQYIGHQEYEYWSLALPLQRILTSKIEKLGKGFYGRFGTYGLFVFCRDLLANDQVEAAVEYALSLQNNLDLRYQTLYLAQTDRLYVCDLTDNRLYQGMTDRIVSYHIPEEQRREFFLKAVLQESEKEPTFQREEVRD
ncbi:MAG: hypothetical protein J6U70_04665 [Bacteroidales bacterium]|nr:hypothetical protein [Bacteroidales bacterium]